MVDKISRKDLKHDKFVDEMTVFYSYVQKQRRNILLVCGGIILLAAIVSGVWGYRAHRESVAQAKLAAAIEVIEGQVGPPTPGSNVPTYKSEDEKIAKATPMFQDVVSHHGGTNAADIADLFLARISASKGDVAAARPKLQKFINEHPGNILAGSAALSLYQLEIANGNAKEAAQQIEQRLNDEKKILPTDVMLDLLARAYEAGGDSGKAREVYHRIATEFPDSPYAADAQRNAPVA